MSIGSRRSRSLPRFSRVLVLSGLLCFRPGPSLGADPPPSHGPSLPSCAELGSRPGLEAGIKVIRQEFTRVEEQAGNGSLRVARISLGGGQNPNELEVRFEGGAATDFEKDPYAAPFRVRRVVLRKTLPAVGPASAAFYFWPDGTLFFAHARGVDLSGAGVYALRPTDEVRVYFCQDVPFRVLANLGGEDGTSKTLQVDLPLETNAGERDRARTAGEALQRVGVALRGALETLAR